MAALGLAATAPAYSTPASPAYIIYDTGTLGGTFAFGAGVDNLGWVTGASLNAAGALHATLAIPGNLIDLGTLGGHEQRGRMAGQEQSRPGGRHLRIRHA